MMVETYLLRGRRQWGKWMALPWFRRTGTGALYLGGGFLLSGAALQGRMLPIAMGLTAGAASWRCICAAVGSMLGYRIFWGSAGLQGSLWALGAMALALLLPFLGDTRKSRLSISCAAVVCGTGLFFQYRLGEALPTRFFILRIALAAVCAGVSDRVLAARDRGAQWLAAGCCVLALCRIPGRVGLAAAGALAAAAPLPAAALAGLAADLSGVSGVCITGTAVLSFFYQLLPLAEKRRRMAAPACAALTAMVLADVWEPYLLLLYGLGGVLGAQLPWRLTAVPRHGSVGRAQVQLEQTSRILLAFRAQLLAHTPPGPEVSALLEQVQQEACGKCTAFSDCRERSRLTAQTITQPGPFHCRREAQLEPALREARERLKRMRAARAQQAEYRTALVQQYGFLSDALCRLADSLPRQAPMGKLRYRIRVCARSRGKGMGDGDRVLAFPGQPCRFYVLLCDGMGTGFGAAEEGRQAGELIRSMLTAGLSPDMALGGLNSQLVLLGRGGAVTADLAEFRLDSGTVRVYKWGAEPCWLLRRGKAVCIGGTSPPPGLTPEGRSLQSRAVMSHGETLVLCSDGIDPVNAPFWARDSDSWEPGALAERIVREDGCREDDATAVVIRLLPLAG